MVYPVLCPLGRPGSPHTKHWQKRTEVRSEELPVKVVPAGFESTWRPLLQQHLGCPRVPDTHLGLCPPRPADSPPTSFAQMKSLSVPGTLRASCLIFRTTSSFTHPSTQQCLVTSWGLGSDEEGQRWSQEPLGKTESEQIFIITRRMSKL